MIRLVDRFASFHVTSIYTSMFTIDPRHVVYGTCAYFRDARVRKTHPSGRRAYRLSWQGSGYRSG